MVVVAAAAIVLSPSVLHIRLAWSSVNGPGAAWVPTMDCHRSAPQTVPQPALV